MLPCGQDAAGVGAGVDRHPRLVGRHDRVAPTSVQVAHVLGVRRELLRRRVGVLGEVVQLHHRRHQGDVPGDHLVDQVLGEAGAVLDAVDARRRSGPGSTASPKQWAVTLAPCSWATRIASAKPRRGTTASRSPVSRSIQSPTSLTQPSPRCASWATYAASSARLDLVGVVADVALGPGDVPAGADQPRQVLALVDPGGVGRRAAVAQQQRARVAVGDGLLLGGLVVDGTVLVEPDVAVGVDQSRDDPPLGHRLGAGLGLVGDQPVDDVEVTRLAVRQDRSPESLCSHAGTLSRAR